MYYLGNELFILVEWNDGVGSGEESEAVDRVGAGSASRFRSEVLDSWRPFYWKRIGRPGLIQLTSRQLRANCMIPGDILVESGLGKKGEEMTVLYASCGFRRGDLISIHELRKKSNRRYPPCQEALPVQSQRWQRESRSLPVTVPTLPLQTPTPQLTGLLRIRREVTSQA